MQVRKAVAGSLIGGSMVAMAVAGMGTASATNDNWSPGHGGWQPGAGLATFSANAKVASGNFNGATGVKVGDIKVLSGNEIKVSALNGNKILSGNSFLNGNFSNNLVNTGKNSFNTTDSYNTVKNTSVVKVWKYDSSTHNFVKVDVVKDSYNTNTNTTTNNTTTTTTTTTGGCVDEEDGNNGHGNDCDHNDEGNPGNS